MHEKIIFKRVADKGVEALYNAYLDVRKSNNDSVCEKSIRYLKAFVQYSPSLCIRIIRTKENEHLTLHPWGGEYIYLLSLIAAYHLDEEEIETGLLWADKAVEMIDYFAPTLKNEIRDTILYNLPALSMICAYPQKHPTLTATRYHFFLDWQIERYKSYGNWVWVNDN